MNNKTCLPTVLKIKNCIIYSMNTFFEKLKNLSKFNFSKFQTLSLQNSYE